MQSSALSAKALTSAICIVSIVAWCLGTTLALAVHYLILARLTVPRTRPLELESNSTTSKTTNTSTKKVPPHML